MPGGKTIAVQAGDFGVLSGEWESLLERSAARSIFLTPQWQELCWQNLDGESWELLLLSIRGTDGPLGLAPLRRRDGTICFVGNVEVSDYLDFVVQTGEEETFYTALLDTLREEQWETLDLHGLSASSPTLSYLQSLAPGKGLSVAIEQETVAPAMDLPDSWDGFLSSLKKKDRHELRRKMRRLTSNVSARYYCLEGEELVGAMDDFLRLHRVSSDEKAAFMDVQMERFFRTIADRLADKEWVKLYFLEVDGERVSTALCFDYDQESLLYNSGFDPGYGWLSVGLLLKAFCVRDAIESGKRRFDFLRGSEHYKYELGGVDAPIYRCQVKKA